MTCSPTGRKVSQETAAPTTVTGGVLYIELGGSPYKIGVERLEHTATPKTHAELVTLKGSDGLTPGLYFITDKNIYINAISVNAFDLWCVYQVRVPNYTGYSNWLPSASYSSGDRVANANAVYENTTGTNTATPASDDGTNYTLEATTNDTYYTTNYDAIEYDFDNDFIVERRDILGNVVRNENGNTNNTTRFRWGDSDVSGNTVNGTTPLDIYKTGLEFSNETVTSLGSSVSYNVALIETVTDFPSTTTCEIGRGDVTQKYKSGNTIEIITGTNSGTYTLASDSTFGSGVTTLTITSTWSVSAVESTVEGSIVDASVILSTSDYSQAITNGFAGIIGIVSITADQPIEKIINTPTGFNYDVYAKSSDVLITHTAKGSATDGEIVLEGGSNVTLSSDSEYEQADILTLRKSSTYNRQINITQI